MAIKIIDFFQVMVNEDGELGIFFPVQDGKPSNPQFLFDDKDTGLLIRSDGNSIQFDNFKDCLKSLLVNAKEMVFGEIDVDNPKEFFKKEHPKWDDFISHVYVTEIRHVKVLPIK